MNPAVAFFFRVLLPATALLGAVAGLLVAHLALVRRGRVSLRAAAAVVLIAALQSAIVAHSPRAWRLVAPGFLIPMAGVALVDAGAILAVDPRRREPRFTPPVRHRAAGVVAAGVVALAVAAVPISKYVIFANPANIAPWEGPLWLTILLAPVAVVDLTVRVVHLRFASIRRREPPGGVSPGASGPRSTPG